jgi:hypothetical protein
MAIEYELGEMHNENFFRISKPFLPLAPAYCLWLTEICTPITPHAEDYSGPAFDPVASALFIAAFTGSPPMAGAERESGG